MTWRAWWPRIWRKLLEGLATQVDHYDRPEAELAPDRYPPQPAQRLLVTPGDKVHGIDVRGREVTMVVDAIELGVAHGVADGRMRRVSVELIDRVYNDSARPEPTNTGIRERSTIASVTNDTVSSNEVPTVRLRAAKKVGP